MNVARLAALILGKPVKKDQLFQFAAIFTVIDFVVFESGIFPKIPPIPVAWQLLVLAPALLFVLVKQSLSLVRFPREPNALFSYGVSFEQRKACVIFHVKQQSSNLMLFISLCYGLLIIGELCFARSNFKALSLVIFLCGYGEVKALEWTLTTIVSGGLLHPTAKDRALRGQWGLGNIQWRRLSIAAIEAVSRQSTRFLGNPVRAVSRRQLLYFMHGDLFASIAGPAWRRCAFGPGLRDARKLAVSGFRLDQRHIPVRPFGHERGKRHGFRAKNHAMQLLYDNQARFFHCKRRGCRAFLPAFYDHVSCHGEFGAGFSARRLSDH